MPAQPVPDIVSENGSTGSRQNNPLERKMRVLVGQKARENKHRLAGEWQTGTLTEKAGKNGPISQDGSDRVVDRMQHAEQS